MTEPAKAPEPVKAPARRKALAFSTATIISFSLTLLAGAVVVLAGLVPLQMSFGERVDVGAMLFTMPVLALVLGVVFEATRIAIKSPELPQPRRQQSVRWSPGRGEG